MRNFLELSLFSTSKHISINLQIYNSKLDLSGNLD